jgi:hypothetical protein
MQQSPKTRNEKVYTTRRPYLTASGTHRRLLTPATIEAVENSKAVLLTADENPAIEAGDSEAGLWGSGGYTPKRSTAISTKTAPGPPAKKLIQVNATHVSMATYILKAFDL